jgi:hypothetical protein
MKVSVRIRNETHPPQVDTPHIIELWDQNNLEPKVIKIENDKDYLKVCRHIKSVICDYGSRKKTFSNSKPPPIYIQF